MQTQIVGGMRFRRAFQVVQLRPPAIISLFSPPVYCRFFPFERHKSTIKPDIAGNHPHRKAKVNEKKKNHFLPFVWRWRSWVSWGMPESRETFCFVKNSRSESRNLDQQQSGSLPVYNLNMMILHRIKWISFKCKRANIYILFPRRCNIARGESRELVKAAIFSCVTASKSIFT